MGKPLFKGEKGMKENIRKHVYKMIDMALQGIESLQTFAPIAFVVMLCVCLLLISCNRRFIDLKYRFNKAYVKWPDWTMKVVEISKRRSYENSNQIIQITAKDGTTYLLHSANVTLAQEDR